jgi:hypothetical protein
MMTSALHRTETECWRGELSSPLFNDPFVFIVELPDNRSLCEHTLVILMLFQNILDVPIRYDTGLPM